MAVAQDKDKGAGVWGSSDSSGTQAAAACTVTLLPIDGSLRRGGEGVLACAQIMQPAAAHVQLRRTALAAACDPTAAATDADAAGGAGL